MAHRFHLAVVLASICCLPSLGCSPEGPELRTSAPHPTVFAASEHLSRRPAGHAGAPQGYWEYLPPGYTETERFPLLIFLHGLFENGQSVEDLDAVLIHGPPRLIADDEWGPELPFVVLAPQHPGPLCPPPDQVDAFLDFALEAYAIDHDRVYLTGISCGATGVWDYVADHPDRVAAAVPISGFGGAAVLRAGCDMAKVPILAFHGAADKAVAPSGTSGPIQTLSECEGANVKATIYGGEDHNVWQRTYAGTADINVFLWMLDQHR